MGPLNSYPVEERLIRIAIPTLTTTPRITGVAEYLIHLLHHLQQIDRENEYFIFTARDNRYMFRLEAKNFHEIIVPLRHTPWAIMRTAYHTWQKFVFPAWCRKHEISVVHLPNTMFVTGRMPQVVTIHDVADLKTKKYSFLRTALRRRMVQSALKRAARVVAVSHSTEEDLRAMGGVDIATIHNGFENPFLRHDASHDGAILNSYGLAEGRYLLFVGTLSLHKNLPNMIRGYKHALLNQKQIPLVICGAPDNAYQEVLQTIEEEGMAEHIKLLRYVDSQTKLALIRNAMMLCLLSSYEGFGFPVLEAQAAGVPALVSNVSSLPEVAGEGALAIDPSDPVIIGEAMKRLVNDDSLRAKLIGSGYQNCKNYSWDRCARQTLAIYESVVKAWQITA